MRRYVFVCRCKKGRIQCRISVIKLTFFNIYTGQFLHNHIIKVRVTNSLCLFGSLPIIRYCRVVLLEIAVRPSYISQ